MARDMRTLGLAARHQMLVTAECKLCKRQASFFAYDLAHVYGGGRDPRNLPFRCERCDNRDCTVTVALPNFERKAEMTVWRPVKVKG